MAIAFMTIFHLFLEQIRLKIQNQIYKENKPPAISDWSQFCEILKSCF